MILYLSRAQTLDSTTHKHTNKQTTANLKTITRAVTYMHAGCRFQNRRMKQKKKEKAAAAISGSSSSSAASQAIQAGQSQQQQQQPAQSQQLNQTNPQQSSHLSAGAANPNPTGSLVVIKGEGCGVYE